MTEIEKHIYLIIELSGIKLDSVDICMDSIFDYETTMSALSSLQNAQKIKRIETGLRAYYEIVETPFKNA